MRRSILILLLLPPAGVARLLCAGVPIAETGQDAGRSASGGGPAAVEFYEVGVRPQAIVVADLDRDGRRDAAVANGGDGTVTVLLGDGTGRLRRTASVAAGPDPSDIGAVDIDRDGDLDLVVANHETSNITALANDGRGRFAPAPGSPFDTGARPHVHGLATGDFDGDGWVDVAVESADTDEVRVLRGGSGGLSAVVAVPVGTMPYFRLGVGDVNGDGRPEILVPGHGDRTVRAVEARQGHLRAADWRIQLTAQPWMVAAGDVDGEGHDDVAVVETDSLSVWLAGPRGFTPAPGSPFAVPRATNVAIGDVDGDDAADVAVGPWDGDEVTVLHGRTAATRRVRMCERPIGLAIADLDGDGSAELLAVCRTTDRLAVTSFAP
jgi:hypothetical protein